MNPVQRYRVDNALAEMEATGYLSEETLRDLSPDEYNLVMERAQSKDKN